MVRSCESKLSRWTRGVKTLKFYLLKVLYFIGISNKVLYYQFIKVKKQNKSINIHMIRIFIKVVYLNLHDITWVLKNFLTWFALTSYLYLFYTAEIFSIFSTNVKKTPVLLTTIAVKRKFISKTVIKGKFIS